MKSALDTLDLLCRCLRLTEITADHGVLAQQLRATPERWSGIIDLANAYYLTPALWAAVRETPLIETLPDDARDFLAETHRLNGVRNAAIRDQAADLVKALNANGIVPLVLKGGVYLFEKDENEDDAFSTRMMTDVDLLVPEQDLERAFAAAEGMGCRMTHDPGAMQHDMRFWRPGDIVALEIHRHVGKQRTLLSPEEAFRAATPLDQAGIRLLAPSPTHRVLHNVFHSEMHDRGYALGRLPLRALHDLKLLTGRHGKDVDWAHIRHQLSAAGSAHVLDAYVFAADRLLGISGPPEVRPTMRSRLHHRWCLAVFERQRLRSLVRAMGAATHVFARWDLEYRYGQPGRASTRHIMRLRHGIGLLGKFRFRAFSKLAEIHRVFYRVGR